MIIDKTYDKQSAVIRFQDGYVYITKKHYPFDLVPIIKDIILSEELMGNALLKVELTSWYKDEIVFDYDATEKYK